MFVIVFMPIQSCLIALRVAWITSLGIVARMTSPAAPLITWRDGSFLRAGRPHRIVAGSIHYFRVHPAQWRDRLERLVALGANTLDTYVAWNVHQPRQDAAPDFTGWRDLGLDVIVRPGPYICSEWDNGGFPSWVSADPDVALRRTNAAFQAHVDRWLDALMPHLAPRQAANGGPIVAFQVENEYGSYGDDSEYVRWARDALAHRGASELLFTADGGNDYFLDGGSVPETLACATLGSRGAESLETWRRRRPGEPFFAVEFWNGWFDHWGDEHHVRDPQESAQAVAEVLDGGGSLCLYMAHGGTNFGLGADSNHDGERIQPTQTSYDSDAPIAEDGTLTAKFYALRPLMHRAAGRELADVPAHLSAPPPVLPPSQARLGDGVTPIEVARELLTDASPAAPTPLTFEQLGVDHGFVLYRSEVRVSTATTIRLPDLADRAQVWLDGEYLGAITETDGGELTVPGREAGTAVLEVLVESVGRINYGPLTGAPKGPLGGVLLGQRFVFGWRHAGLDLARPEVAAALRPRLATATFDVTEDDAGVASTHLALPESERGYVWVNDVLLGRFDTPAGPQRTLYVPAGLMRAGTNTVSVLDVVAAGSVVELRDEPDLGQATMERPASAEVV